MAKTIKQKVKPKVTPEAVLEVGQKVMVAQPSAIHKAYHGAQGLVVSVSGFRAEVKLFCPTEKQREFAVKELRAL